MRVSIVPSQVLLPQSSVKLGRFITSVEYPQQHHHDPLPAIQPITIASSRSAYSGEYYAARGNRFRSALVSLLSARISKNTKLKIRLTTENFMSYSLDNSEAWFEEATRLPATQAWIERAIDRGHDVYMIVGFHTVTDASIQQESATGMSAGGHGEAPVNFSLAAAGIAAPLAGIVDPSIGFQRQWLDKEQSRFVAPGEQVCAIEYRKIRHTWLSSRRVDRSRLSDVRQWPSIERARDEDDGEDDIIEVGLKCVDDLDRDWDKEIVEDEMIFIRSG